MIIAVDFDGTIVEHEYPKIGKPIAGAIDSLIRIQNAGHKLILWTYRNGETLYEAAEYCEKNGIELYAVNSSTPDGKMREGESRLIEADLFIDDRNVGGLLPWSTVEKMILGN